MTADDVQPVVRLHRAAFEGYMNTLLGTRYLEAFFRWWITDPRSVALVVEADGGKILGYVVGGPAGGRGALTRTLAVPALVGFVRRPGLLLQRRVLEAIGGRVRHFVPGRRNASGSTGTGTFSLIGIGVSPPAEGMGVGRVLISQFERQARMLGAQSVRLTVHSGNAGARRLYEGAGWSLDEAKSNDCVTEYRKSLIEA
jgi:ribosomal protein S18 acetylase RimI-like enzyme